MAKLYLLAQLYVAIYITKYFSCFQWPCMARSLCMTSLIDDGKPKSLVGSYTTGFVDCMQFNTGIRKQQLQIVQ